MQKILLIDDDERLAELLSQYFQRYDMQLDSALRPSEGLHRLGQNHYDLVILDIMLPEMDGFEVCKLIRKDNNIPIIMLTARGEVMDRVVGLELGADDYLPKPFEPRELVARIQSIIKRTRGYQANILNFGELSIDSSTKTASLTDRPISLSSMEFQLLELLASHAGETLSRDDILNRLKGIDGDILTRSVDIAVSRLRHKLKPLEIIKTIRGSGYLFTGTSS